MLSTTCKKKILQTKQKEILLRNRRKLDFALYAQFRHSEEKLHWLRYLPPTYTQTLCCHNCTLRASSNGGTVSAKVHRNLWQWWPETSWWVHRLTTEDWSRTHGHIYRYLHPGWTRFPLCGSSLLGVHWARSSPGISIGTPLLVFLERNEATRRSGRSSKDTPSWIALVTRVLAAEHEQHMGRGENSLARRIVSIRPAIQSTLLLGAAQTYSWQWHYYHRDRSLSPFRRAWVRVYDSPWTGYVY